MQADKRKRQIQMRSNDIMKYTAVINSLLTVGAQFNGVPVSDAVIDTAVINEMVKLIKTVGVTDERLKAYFADLSWKENSPEFIEFNSAVTQAVSEVNNNLYE